MKHIELTKKQVAIVDDWWYDYLNQWNWSAVWDQCTKSFYAVRIEKGKRITMHRVVAMTPKGMICDHIHHNTLDNREKELRNVTSAQSNINRGITIKNKLGVKGVSKHKNRKGFMAELTFQGERVLYKYFLDLNKAIKARREAEKRYFGDFAYKVK